MEKEMKGGIRALKNDVSGMRDSIDRLMREKEGYYRAKEDLSRKIGELIARIKELKSQRDSLTKQVKEKKEGRDKLNSLAKAESEALNALVPEKQGMMKKRKIRLPLSEIAREIESLEFKIETEGYTFEREKSEMRKIKELKAQFRDSKEIREFIEKISAKQHLLREYRKKANSLHSEIKSLSAESQRLHEEMLAVSKQIDWLKPQRDEAAKKWAEKKDEISRLNLLLREKLQALGHAKAEMDRMDMQKIKIREAEAEEKIRRGGKLTTEDLLVFQELAKR